MAMKRLFIVLILLALCTGFAQAEVIAHFFYGQGCPHCADEEPVLDMLEDKYPELTINRYETWYDSDNAELFTELSDACSTTIQGVPTFFIGEEVIVGFRKGVTDKQIEDAIITCIDEGCIDPMEKTTCEDPTHQHTIEQNSTTVKLPIFGEIDAQKVSLPVFTIVIAVLDGFNPCAMWVLTFLLTLLIYAKSRKKMILVGGIFVLTSGLIYFIFMSAWLNFFLIVGYVNIMRIIIALIAVIVGLINIKEFFWFKKGISLTIPDKYKPKLFAKMRQLVKEEATPAIILGTIVLAVFANLFELLCTAGFPAIFTNILTQSHISTASYYGYLALYNTVYVVPLAVIVAVFAYTMGAHRFTDKHGKILKIISGALMLALGLILLLNPSLLSF